MIEEKGRDKTVWIGESIDIAKNRASAVQAEAEGLAVARGLEAQQLAVGKEQTMAGGLQRFIRKTSH